MVTRRAMLSGAAAMGIGAFARGDDRPSEKVRAVVIGHTGKGDYGHGLDTIFAGRNDIEVVAVADANEAGRARALRRCAAARAYADYREMLEKERPAIVSVAPRTTGERRDMLLAALSANAHVISEKPFVRIPADGDEVLKLAGGKNRRIAVAHQMRIAPSVRHLKQRVAGGAIGDLLEMRAFGKQDQRAGGEDMVVLGTHLFDLMRLFVGDPQWCTAGIKDKGREAKINDARQAGEDIGPVLGDDIVAQFAFPNSVTASFTSRGKMREMTGHWGIELIGSKGAARILADIWPRVMIREAGKWDATTRTDNWRMLDDDPTHNMAPADRATPAQNARLRDDWLAAIREGRDAECSGRNAAWAVEMVHGVWRAGLTAARILFPLRDRTHALEA